MKILGFHFLASLTLLSVGPSAAQEANPETERMVSIADARARVARPDKEAVTVQGRVTFCCEKLGMAFLQDKTGGICFDPRSSEKTLELGDFVKLTGVVVKRREMIVLHAIAEPRAIVQEAPTDFTIEPMLFDLDDTGKVHADGLLTRVTGVVRSVTEHPSKHSLMVAEISFPNGTATVVLPWASPPGVREKWLNAMVVCDAVLVCPAPTTMAGKEVDALLLVPDVRRWSVRPEVLDSLFAQRPVEDVDEIASAQRLNVDGLVAQRVHLAGVVTAASAKQWAAIRIAGRSVMVSTDQVERFEPGMRVSVACCPQMRRGSLVLLDGVLRRTSKDIETVPPVPLRGDVSEAGAMPWELVQLRGMLRNDPDWRGLPLITLVTSTGTRFLIQWDTFLSQEKARNAASGSEVLLTGILKPMAKGPSEDAPAFMLIPRTVHDVKLLRSPSWWTRPRLMAAAGWMSLIAGLGLCTTLVSRWQIRRQRQAVREAEARAIAMEERSRIARELHDSLQQHLAGAALHVEALQGAMGAVPQMLPHLLDETAAMIRHCQLEARHCIWDLRSTTPGGEDLPGALTAWLQMKSSQTTGMRIGFCQEGEMPHLGKETIFQILRIVQEAVNNALAHARAREITVHMKGDRQGLLITISDDGCGFDVNAALVRKHGHFGLRSQRERSARIKGGLEFDSQLQNGTRVTLQVPADSSPP